LRQTDVRNEAGRVLRLGLPSNLIGKKRNHGTRDKRSYHGESSFTAEKREQLYPFAMETLPYSVKKPIAILEHNFIDVFTLCAALFDIQGRWTQFVG
jgi:hypothetical protein